MSFNPVLDARIPLKIARLYQHVYKRQLKRFMDKDRNYGTTEDDVIDYMESKFHLNFKTGWKRRYIASTMEKLSRRMGLEVPSSDDYTSPPTPPSESKWEESSSGEDSYHQIWTKKSSKIPRMYLWPTQDESYDVMQIRMRKFPLLEEQPSEREIERTMKNFRASESEYDSVMKKIKKNSGKKEETEEADREEDHAAIRKKETMDYNMERMVCDGMAWERRRIRMILSEKEEQDLAEQDLAEQDFWDD